MRNLIEIKINIALLENNIKLAPSQPYIVYNNKFVIIPPILYDKIFNMIVDTVDIVKYV